MRRLLAVGALLSLLPAVALLVAARPAVAETQGYDSVATTALAAGIRTDGVVGVSGGLVTLQSGSAEVAATLDSAPASHVVAAPYEPGAVRTVVAEINNNAGQQVLTVPDAEASYPGATTSASLQTVPPASAGPVAAAGGAATATAGPDLATGTATGASYQVQGLLEAGTSTTDVRMTADAVTGRVSQTARTTVSSLYVGGVLHLDDVVATATTSADFDTHTASQVLTIGGASVAGQAVVIGNDGVTAVGTPLLPGQTLADATAQADAVLAAAGISTHTVGGVARHDDRSADADTGGVLISVVQADLPGGVAGNTFSVLVGGVALTELDSLPAVLPPVSGITSSLPPVQAAGPTTTFVPGTPGSQGISGASPTLAAPLTPASYVVAGRRISARTALLAFAVWQLLSLGLPTLYALVERRRRLQVAGP